MAKDTGPIKEETTNSESVEELMGPMDNTEVPETPSTTETTKEKPDSTPTTSKPFYKQKKVLIGAGIFVLVLVIGIIVWQLTKKDPVTTSTTPQQTEQTQKPTLGAAASVIDGVVEISPDGTNWQELTSDSKLEQGSHIKTSANGRAVITLDDGSAIRVNTDSEVVLTNLDANNIEVTNNNGEVYTRVVTSDRTFSVKVEDESFEALGTAYKTINRSDTKGVEVYQSEVSAKKADQKVAEGKRYYQSNPATDLVNKISDIPLDQLQKDEFLKWNLEHDKKASEFKDKLGFLATLEKTPAPTTPKVTNGITLSGVKSEKGASLSWKVTGISVTKGFKVVKGESANPVYGEDDATFVEASLRSLTWKLKDGKTYHFRVCVYNTDGTCTNYSNNVSVTVPYEAPPTPPTGSLNLLYKGSGNVGWDLSGSAPYGLKLVWSTSPGPTYPGSNAKYYDGASLASTPVEGTSGTSYFVRVCMYYEGTCVNYSNELSVMIP